MSLKYPINFEDVARRCNGMLSPAVYQAIADTAAAVKSGDIIEIGTAHGAATIALAEGYKRSAAKGKIITTDKVVGGSREQFGDANDHLRIVNDNFKHFGVDDVIEARACSSEDLKLKKGAAIGLLMIDADGALDRDFMLFYDRLPPGAPIILDDYLPDFVGFHLQGRALHVDQKQKLVTLLIHYFEDKGLIVREKILGCTWFGHKPKSAKKKTDFDLKEINAVYRELVFSEGRLSTILVEAISTATRKFPGVHKALKDVYLKIKN